MQRPEAFGLHVFNDHLVVAARFVDTETSADKHFKPVLGAELQAGVAVAEERGLDLSPVVLEGKIHMAGRVMLEIGDLTLDPEDAEYLQGLLYFGGNLGDAVYLPLVKEVHGPLFTMKRQVSQ